MSGAGCADVGRGDLGDDKRHSVLKNQLGRQPG